MEQPICKDTDILSTPCEAATADDSAVVQDLLDTLAAHSEDCVGLAANQIGVTKRIVVFDDNGTTRIMLNPKVMSAMKPYKAAEACLSLEGESAITRYMRIKVSYDELVDGELVARKKQFSEWTAQIVQHLIDHCNGRLV